MITFNIFKKNNISISWKTVIVGRKLRLADTKFVEDFATDYVSEHPESKNIAIMELAYGVKDEFEVDALLYKLTQELQIELQEDSQEYEFEQRKWRFARLYLLLEQNYINDKMLEKIEDIYCDFQHPEDMNEFIVYMPHDASEEYDYKLHTSEENKAYMVKRFKRFVQQEQQALSSKS